MLISSLQLSLHYRTLDNYFHILTFDQIYLLNFVYIMQANKYESLAYMRLVAQTKPYKYSCILEEYKAIKSFLN